MKRVALVALVALVCGVVFGETRNYALLGFDSYPLIASARVGSPGDLAGLVTEPLMDGRYPSAFYRPVVSASLALDYALYGLEPAGYQATSVLILGALALAAALLTAASLGHAAPVAAGVAALALLFHPAAYELVAVPPRRADLFCALFMALALAVQLRGPSTQVARSRGRFLLIACLAALAIASKETAFVLPALSFLAGWLWAEPLAGSGRLRVALRSAMPSVLALGVMLAARFAVLGQLGGHRLFDLAEVAASAPAVVLAVLGGIVLPPDLAAGAPGVVGAVVLAIWGGGAALLLASADAEARQSGRVVALGLSWAAVAAVAYAGNGWIGAWYWLMPAVGLALALAAAADLAIRKFQATGPAAPALPWLLALTVVSILGWNASRTPFFHHYEEWGLASGASDDFLAGLLPRIAAAPDGTVVTAPPIPMWAQPRPSGAGGPAIQGAAILSDYSVQAWADLVFPERRVRVLGVPGGVLAAGPHRAEAGEVVVSLPRRAVGF